MILIGTPVWAFDYCSAIRTFVTQGTRNIKNRLFCCHEGAKGKTFDHLQNVLSDNTIIGEMDFLNVQKHKKKIKESTELGSEPERQVIKFF